MRVLIDYRPALRARTGVGEYMHGLTRALVHATAARGWSIAIFTSSWKDRPAPTLAAELAPATIVDRRIPGRVLNLLWHRAGWPAVESIARQTFDVVHAAHPLLIPAARAARLITVHDLDFLKHPERTHGEIRRDYPALAASHAARADRIVTPSAFTAGEVERELHVPRAKITVCHAGVPDWTTSTDHTSLALPAEPYILFLGTLEPRKNVGLLLDAYERLTAERPSIPPLVVAGAPTATSQAWIARAAAGPLRGRVIFPGYVSAESRRHLYERALMFVLPSHHEGFGITALEAMSLGVPVIASNRGSLPEVVGDAGLLVDPTESAGLAAAIRRMIDDEALAAACRTRGRERAATFTWRAAAERLIEAYELALEDRRRRA